MMEAELLRRIGKGVSSTGSREPALGLRSLEHAVGHGNLAQA